MILFFLSPFAFLLIHRQFFCKEVIISKEIANLSTIFLNHLKNNFFITSFLIPAAVKISSLEHATLIVIALFL